MNRDPLRHETAALSDPITEGEGAALLDAVLGDEALVAVAVSGGPDSTALLHVADRWARRRGRRLLVLTVDHGLRAGSAAESASMAALARALGHEHRTLHWQGYKPSAGLQAAAREARMGLLASACLSAGAGTLMLAHHLEDQAETVLHRIDRDTGPEGLAAMASETWRLGVRLVRPFLTVPKGRLLDTCRAAGLSYSEDPSNDDPRFNRVRLRRMRADLDAVGVTVDRLTRLAAAMGIARRRMDAEVRAWLAAHGRIHGCGTLRFDRAALIKAPGPLVDAVLRRAFRIAAGDGYPPRTAALAALADWIASAASGGRRTLGGCLFEICGETVAVMREAAACASPRTVEAGGTLCWDGRFLICNRTFRPVRIGACGPDGWRRIKRLGIAASLSPEARALPHAARLAWPIVTDLDGVVVLPHLVAGERTTPGGWGIDVSIHLLATRERRIDGPMADGRLTT
ncbi:MAG: tRNA lysidine(34) synthetase TilS [Alphaproteobacteria bacterium]|nr:tRNA lysidine(34) synthetase TilS [Alphaproteobacteria bacterium]